MVTAAAKSMGVTSVTKVVLASGYLCWLRQREWLMCPVLIGEAVLSEEQCIVKSRA